MITSTDFAVTIPDIQFPSWLTWVLGVPSGLAAWFGLYLALRREWRERTRPRFNMKPRAYVDEDHVEHFEIRMTITNQGARPITIERCACRYAFTSPKRKVERTASCQVSQKIGMGDACHGDLVLAVEPDEVTTVHAVDSTGREWKPSKKEVRAFYRLATLCWSDF
jgi:hypothetical protein